MKRPLLFTGISGAMAVGLETTGAHALKNKMEAGLITADQLNAFDTAALPDVSYPCYCTGSFFITLPPIKNAYPSLRLFTAGIVLFSGSLYLLSTRQSYLTQNGLQPLVRNPAWWPLFYGWLAFVWANYLKRLTDSHRNNYWWCNSREVWTENRKIKRKCVWI